MFVTQTRISVSITLLLAIASTALAATFIKGSFTETRESLPNAVLGGQFFYYYENSNVNKSRLRFVYSLASDVTVSNLYDFENSVMYSMCTSNCTAEKLFVSPDKWWYDSNTWKKGAQDGEMFWFSHSDTSNTTSYQVSEILMKEGPLAADSLGAIKFSDGRIVEVSNVQVNPSGLSSSSSEFAIDSGLICPNPTCSIYTDIVFVLDSSGSVSPASWKKGADFVKDVMHSFKFGDNAAAAAVVQFNAPDRNGHCSDLGEMVDICYGS